jgi:hypothetical protein
MQSARFFYFSFTYRFSFVEGGEDGSVRARLCDDDLKS